MANDRQNRAARAEQMRKEREKADRKQRNMITVGIVAIVVVMIGVGGYGIKSISDKNQTVDEVIQPTNATKDFGIEFDAAAAGGKVDAKAKPVSIELYEDFQCPACKAFEESANGFLMDLVASNAATITYRPFSFLDEMGGSPNDWSKRSTSAALCVLDAKGPAEYKKVHDYLYSIQPTERAAGPTNAEIIEQFADLGYTGLDECIRTEKYVPWVKEAKKKGQDRGVSGTPAVFVDGKQIENPSAQAIQAAVDAAAK
jgi:protein-disulfide isomerase